MTAPARPSSASRWALAAGAVGLVSGLALGATGLATAAGSTPSPSPAPSGAAPDRPDRGPGGRLPGHRGAGKRAGGPGGLVAAITADSLTLRTPRGTRTIGLTKDTVFYEGLPKGRLGQGGDDPATKVTASAVQVGEPVVVRLVDPGAATPVAAVVRVLPARVGGWVTSVEGTTITVLDRFGFSRQIRTSDSTAFRRAGAASTLSSITAGELVMASGEVSADRTSLDADLVVIGAPPRGDAPAAGGAGSADGDPAA